MGIPSGVGLTFGNDGEKIEGDGTDLTISGNNINLTAVLSIVATGNLAVTGTITGDTSLTLDTTTISTAEIGVLDGVTGGTALASKALVVNGSKNIAGIG